MAYSTPGMIRKALVPTSDGTLPEEPTFTAADLTDPQLVDAIAEADILINGYIGRLYITPVDLVGGAVPHPIDYWSRNIAAYNATLTLRGSQDFADQDPVARRYNATMEALKAVAAGTMRLELLRNDSPSSASTAGAPINPYTGELFCVNDFDLTAPWSGQMPGPFWRGF